MKNLAQWEKNGSMTKKIDSAIVQMICTDILPLSFTSGPGFKNMLKIIAPNYSPKYFINVIIIY